MPTLDAWTLRLEVAAPAPLAPNVSTDFREQWLDAGVKETKLVDFKYTNVAERKYWTTSELDSLLDFSIQYAVPWLRRIQGLAEIRAFYERSLAGLTENPVSGCLDESMLVALLHESRNQALLNKNLGLVCYWQGDFISAHRYLMDYKDTLVKRFKSVRHPEVNARNVSHLKKTQELIDEVSLSCDVT